jgi:hypothetical protein
LRDRTQAAVLSIYFATPSGLGPTNRKLPLKSKIAREYIIRLSIAWWHGNHTRVGRLRVRTPACALYFATYIGQPMWDTYVRSAGVLCGTPLSGRWGRAVGPGGGGVWGLTVRWERWVGPDCQVGWDPRVW